MFRNLMLHNLLPDNPQQRLLELVPPYFFARALLLLGLGACCLLLMLMHIRTLPEMSFALGLFGAYAVSLLLANLYLLLVYPVRESFYYPSRTRHPLLFLLVSVNYTFALWLLTETLPVGDSHLLSMCLAITACSACGLKWPSAITLLTGVNLLAFWQLGAFIDHSWFLVLVFCQLILFVLFKFVIEEFHSRTILGWNLAELHATQRLLKDSVEQATRHEIARNLHDELGHLVTLISINLNRHLTQHSTTEPLLLETRALTTQLGQQVRSIAHCLRESDSIDIRSALELLCQQVRRPQIQLTFTGFDGRCSAPVGETLFRACQECITNSLRHSSATAIDIHLQQQENRIQVDIRDNGSIPAQTDQGSGLQGIRERVAALNGNVEFSASAAGFHVQINLPHLPVPHDAP